MTSDHNDPDLDRAYHELLKTLPLRGNVELAATTAPFRPLTAVITDLPSVERSVQYKGGLFQRCQRAVDRAQRLCEAAEQIVWKLTITHRLPRSST